MLTVRATEPETMQCVDQLINTKFRETVKSTPPADRTGTNITTDTPEQVIEQLKQQNSILTNQEIGIQRHYDIMKRLEKKNK